MDSLRFGILSTARVGRRRVVPAMQQAPNILVRAVASRDARRAQAFAHALSIPKAYGCYEDLLADPEVDAVYIPLPNSLHCQWTVKAAQAGKHVLCEKPLAASAREADEMIAACEANHVLLMEAFMYRFHPQNEHVLGLIQDGAIGPVRMVRAVFTFTIGSSNIRLDAALAGGSLMDVGCYCVSVARTIVGAEPRAVSAFANRAVGSRNRSSRCSRTAAGILASAGPRFTDRYNLRRGSFRRRWLRSRRSRFAARAMRWRVRLRYGTDLFSTE